MAYSCFYRDISTKIKTIYIVCTPHQPPFLGGEGGGSERFFRTFIQEGLRSDLDFGQKLALQVGVIVFRWDLNTPCIKLVNRHLKQKRKKKILIVVSTIFHFWSPTLRNFWQFGNLGEGARPFFSIKPSMTNHVNSRIVYCKIICFISAC